MINFERFKEIYQNEGVREYISFNRPKPLVSVLVQTYNHSDFISDCLEGILNQKTVFPYEIILGEDGSIDGTRDLCIQYAQSHSDKIRLFLHHPSNKIKVRGIPTGNFNVAYNFFSSRAPYVAFCEGDDIWKDPLKLQKQVSFLTAFPDYVLSYHQFDEIHVDDRPIRTSLFLDQPAHDFTSCDLQMVKYHPHLSTVLFRKSFAQIPIEMLRVINMDSFLLSILGSYGKAKYQSDIKANIYRRHDKGLWSSQLKILKFQLKILTYYNLRLYYLKRDKKLARYFQGKQRDFQKQLLLLLIKKGKLREIKQLLFSSNMN